MTVFGLLGVLLGLLAFPVFLRGETFQRLVLAVAVASVHLAATVAYYVYTKSNFADAFGYYHFDIFYASMPSTSLGVAFAGHVTQWLKHSLGATYLDCFLIFQSFGLWGLLTILQIFKEVAAKTGTKEVWFSYYLLFLPSIQFWTSAIGKDAPVFFAVALFTWSMLSPKRRIVPALSAAVLVTLFRAHIALAMGIALTGALLLERGIGGARKAFLLVISLIGVLVLVYTVQDTFSVDVMSSNSVSQFMDDRALSEASDNGGTALRSTSLIVRFISLVFRPLFFDAKNAMAMVASVENIGSVLLFGFFILNFNNIRQLSKQVFFIRFCIFFSAVLLAVLTVLNYNVGLGMRERVMSYPPLFALLMATLGYRRLKAGKDLRTAPARVPVSAPMPVIRPDGRLPTT